MIFIKRGNEVKGGTDIVYVEGKAYLYNKFTKDGNDYEEIIELTPDWEVYKMG